MATRPKKMPKKKGLAPLEFDIIGPEGAALQSDGKYGRSVRFKDGTEYVIDGMQGGWKRCRQCQFRPHRVLLLPGTVGEEYAARRVAPDEKPTGWARRRARGRAHDSGRRTAYRARLPPGPAQHTGRGHAGAAVPGLPTAFRPSARRRRPTTGLRSGRKNASVHIPGIITTNHIPLIIIALRTK